LRELQLLLAGWAGACPLCLRRLPKSMGWWQPAAAPTWRSTASSFRFNDDSGLEAGFTPHFAFESTAPERIRALASHGLKDVDQRTIDIRVV
jgi:hypothetical protein